jgi:lipopolysaccharide/colanic/teichoic acid biosynthesis glycosyltransferase
MMRRAVDLLVAAIVLPLAAPLCVLLALAVRLDSPGNPFYGGRRVGKDGLTFRMWKLRTMIVDADRVGPGITGKRDARITRIGTFLRRTKLDELPQFINLLTGELTLVGPRAEVPDIVDRFTPEQRAVLTVKPGITGPGTIYYTIDQADAFPEGVAADDYYVLHLLGPKLAIDIDYIRNRTIGSDVKIVGATFGLMLRALFGRDV